MSPPTAPRVPRWRPAPFVSASLGLHAAAAALLALAPREWPWAAGGVLLDHALLTAAGLWPRSTLLGPNWTHLPPESAARREIAITLDDGPDPELTPRVLDLLDARGVRATFFGVGARVEAHPALARELVARGHALENHSQHHSYRFSLLGPRAMRAEVEAGQHAIADTVGVAPRFFRAPAGLRNPFLDPVLAALGLRLAAWTRRGFDTRSGDARRVERRLTAGLGAGDILLLHDGRAARTAAGEPVSLVVLPRLLEAVQGAALVPVTLGAALDGAAVGPSGASR